MNTQKGFLGNAEDDESGIDRAGDLDTEMCSSMRNDTEEMCSSMCDDKYRECMPTTSEGFVKILDLREGNEEDSEETTGCKASVFEEFDDCPRAGKFVGLLSFRHSTRFFSFSKSDRKTYKKAISDGVNVSVVLEVVSRNTWK